MNNLTPAQSADVIRYYHNGENIEYRRRGWRDKTALGLSALHAAKEKHSISPDNQPLLTAQEVKGGLEYIDEHSSKPSEVTEAVAMDIAESFIEPPAQEYKDPSSDDATESRYVRNGRPIDVRELAANDRD